MNNPQSLTNAILASLDETDRQEWQPRFEELSANPLPMIHLDHAFMRWSSQMLYALEHSLSDDSAKLLNLTRNQFLRALVQAATPDEVETWADVMSMLDAARDVGALDPNLAEEDAAALDVALAFWNMEEDNEGPIYEALLSYVKTTMEPEILDLGTKTFTALAVNSWFKFQEFFQQ